MIDISDLIETSLGLKPYAIKDLQNGMVKWYSVPTSTYNIIFTKWMDGCIHIEYRNMKKIQDYKVIYTDLPYEKTNAIFDQLDTITHHDLNQIISDQVPVSQRVCTSLS